VILFFAGSLIMSRVGTGDAVVVKPSNNVYTVLLAIATLAAVLAVVVVAVKDNSLFGAGLF
jgi:hypothetical protein